MGIGRRGALALSVLAVAAMLAAASGGVSARAGFGVKVSGNHLTTLAGRTIRLLGVNRSGAEYMCTNPNANSVFDGPTSAASIATIKSWHVNAVRVPLNEDCWLDINGANPRLSGAPYRAAVERYVRALNAAGLYVILDLHWAAPGANLPTAEWLMADEDHSPSFWESVANRFKTDRGVVFDLFNEPHVSWPCWRDGCTTTYTLPSGANVTYRTAGMQQLVDLVRSTGAANPIMLGGNSWGTDERQWANYEPADPDHQLIVSFHSYPTECDSVSCWNTTVAPLANKTPVVTGEFGEGDCKATYALRYMRWADAHHISYLAWAWDATDRGWSCDGPALIVDYNGKPTGYGIGVKSHLDELWRRHLLVRGASAHFVK